MRHALPAVRRQHAMTSLRRLHICKLTSCESAAKHGSESYTDIAASLAGCGVGPAQACALGSGGSKLTESHGSRLQLSPCKPAVLFQLRQYGSILRHLFHFVVRYVRVLGF